MAYNKIYNEEDWNRVNKENKNIIDDFLLECRARKKKPTTIAQYKNDLRILAIYCLKCCDNKSLLSMTKRDFRNFSLWLSDDLSLSNARVNRLMSATRSLLDFCEDEDEYEYNNNVAKKVKGLEKESVREIYFLEDNKILGMKQWLIENKEYQKATLLMLLYDSCARKNEVAQVLKDSFYDESKNVTNKVVGKRGKTFQLLYFDGTKECAKLWLEQRGEDDIKELFVVGKGKFKHAATADNIYDWFVSLRSVYYELYGEKINFNVHSMRHSALNAYSTGEHYVCKLLGKIEGFSVDKLKLMAHHESTETTEGYLQCRDDEILFEAFGINGR